jgi:hypothetical protein
LQKSFAVNRLEFLKFPGHLTALYIISRVPDPDTVVLYAYGGTVPHHFYTDHLTNMVRDQTSGKNPQFTWEWIDHWLDQNVAIAIFDFPTYFNANGIGWVSSFYRLTDDRRRESLLALDMLADIFPSATLNLFGISYGALDAANISQVDSPLCKIISSSGTWHVVPNLDSYHQGGRLNNYDVSMSKKPVLVVMHKKEVWEKAEEQMAKTDSILVTNDVSREDGHFFRGRQKEVITAMCDWLRDRPIPKIIP